MYKAYPRYSTSFKSKGCSNSYLQGMFFLKAFYWGQKGARDNYSLQFQNIVEHGYNSLGETPVIVGECGVPMDLKFVFS